MVYVKCNEKLSPDRGYRVPFMDFSLSALIIPLTGHWITYWKDGRILSYKSAGCYVLFIFQIGNDSRVLSARCSTWQVDLFVCACRIICHGVPACGGYRIVFSYYCLIEIVCQLVLSYVFLDRYRSNNFCELDRRECYIYLIISRGHTACSSGRGWLGRWEGKESAMAARLYCATRHVGLLLAHVLRFGAPRSSVGFFFCLFVKMAHDLSRVIFG